MFHEAIQNICNLEIGSILRSRSTGCSKKIQRKEKRSYDRRANSISRGTRFRMDSCLWYRTRYWISLRKHVILNPHVLRVVKNNLKLAIDNNRELLTFEQVTSKVKKYAKEQRNKKYQHEEHDYNISRHVPFFSLPGSCRCSKINYSKAVARYTVE